MEKIVDKHLGFIRTYEVVDEYPQGYVVWRIGRKNFKHECYIPLARPASEPFHIDPESLKALKLESEELALYVMETASKTDVNHFNFSDVIRRFKNAK